MICFLLRQLLGFVFAVFLMAQPIFAAATAYNVVDTLNDFVHGGTSFEDANRALSNWDNSEPFNPYIRHADGGVQWHDTDDYGNTIAHKFLEHYPNISIKNIQKISRLFGPHIFYQKNYYGLDPFEDNPEVLKLIKGKDLKSTPLDPNLKNKLIKSMDQPVEILLSKKEKAHQRFDLKFYKETIGCLDNSFTCAWLARLQYTADTFKTAGLNDDLWDRLANDEMISSSLKYNDCSTFDSFGFYTVLNQHSQTAVHRSFLQQNPTDFTNREQANRLWQSLFEKSNDLHSLYGRCGGYVDSECNMSPAVRVLGIIRDLEDNASSDFEGEHRQELGTLQANLLSSGGTFGMNFNRTANQEEAQIMIDNLCSFARRVMDTEQIINSLFSYSVTNSILQAKLDDHQINCAIFALSELPEFSYKTRKLMYKHIKKPYEDDIFLPDFRKIDDFLKVKHPRMKDKDINSKIRYSHLKSFAGFDPIYDPD